MKRRLPYEPAYLVQELTSWIDWRYAGARRRLVLTSAPSSLPPGLERWRPNAVWRLAWQGNGTALLFGLAPGDSPTTFFVVQHDALGSHKEGVFMHADGTWQQSGGDSLGPPALGRRHRARAPVGRPRRGGSTTIRSRVRAESHDAH